jgi:ubiquinone/menaquinone biosynthesis C-methylase UbiE
MKPTKDNFEQWNEELAKKHDLDKFYNHPNAMFRYIENKRIKVLIDLADIKSNSEVLEVGCGAGHILEKIMSGNLHGIDISEIQIERAQKRLKGKVKLSKAPGEKIPYPDNHFDSVLCSEVIEHVLDPVEVLTEIKRVMKKGGILSLSIPNEDVINKAKKFLKKTGLIKLIDNTKNTDGWEIGTKDNLDEWHLHNFSLDLIKKYSKGVFKLNKYAAIPNALFPARYVLQFEKE